MTETSFEPQGVVPVVDLADSFSDNAADRKRVAMEIRTACRDIGFFYVSNHGIPAALVDAQLELARRFFDLPMEFKQEVSIAKSPCMRGYEGMKMQRLDVTAPPDLKESFQMARDLGPEHEYVRKGVPNQGSNQWPSVFPELRAGVEAYHAEVMKLGTHLMRCLALSLALPETYFDKGLAEPMCSVRMLHYPPQPQDIEANQLGAGEHTDWGSLTILLQDGIGGLQVRNTHGEWIDAVPLPGTFVVNLGDMVRRWTNDLYKSTLHRVRNNTSGKHRYSAASFFNPDYFYKVECVPTCLPENREPAYEPCTVGEHIAQMFRLTYGQIDTGKKKRA